MGLGAQRGLAAGFAVCVAALSGCSSDSDANSGAGSGGTAGAALDENNEGTAGNDETDETDDDRDGTGGSSGHTGGSSGHTGGSSGHTGGSAGATSAGAAGRSGAEDDSGGSTGSTIELGEDGNHAAGSGGNGLMSCAATETLATLTPIYMVFMYDTSGSMGDQTFSDGSVLENRAQRWEPLKEGMTDFFTDPSTSTVYASLDYFPADGDFEQACSVEQYALPSVGLTPLSAPDALLTSLDAQEPQGGTPTLPALRGAVQYARELKTETPAAHVVVVLITDGEPAMVSSDTMELEPNCPEGDSLQNTVEGVAAVARAAYTGSPSIPVHVIGVGNSLDSLSMIASAGGTVLTLIGATDPADTTATLTSALEEISVAQFSCDIPLPEPPNGELFDQNLVNVSLRHPGGSVETFARSVGCNTGAGWTYDSEPDPTKILLCPSTCDTILNDASGQLRVEFGCETLVDES